MSHTQRHKDLARAVSLPLALLLGLAVAVLLLVVAVSPSFAFGAASQDAHACCHDGASMPAPCTHGAMAPSGQSQCASQCDCRISPASAVIPADAVALSGNTFSVGPAGPAHANPQIHIPLAREPDGPGPAPSREFAPNTPAIYLLNATLRL